MHLLELNAFGVLSAMIRTSSLLTHCCSNYFSHDLIFCLAMFISPVSPVLSSDRIVVVYRLLLDNSFEIIQIFQFRMTFCCPNLFLRLNYEYLSRTNEGLFRQGSHNGVMKFTQMPILLQRELRSESPSLFFPLVFFWGYLNDLPTAQSTMSFPTPLTVSRNNSIELNI